VLLNKQVTLASAVTFAGWAVAVGIWIVSWILHSDHLGQGGILVAIIAGVTTSQLGRKQQAQKLHNALTIVSAAEVRPMQRR
jgi:hypothetical protein